MSVNVVSYNIENLLYKKHISYRELGRRLNRDSSTVSNHILEPHRLTLDEIIKIAAAIGVDWRSLLEGLD